MYCYPFGARGHAPLVSSRRLLCTALIRQLQLIMAALPTALVAEPPALRFTLR